MSHLELLKDGGKKMSAMLEEC